MFCELAHCLLKDSGTSLFPPVLSHRKCFPPSKNRGQQIQREGSVTK